MIPTHIFLFLALACCLLSGCYGGGVVHSRTTTTENFSLGYRGEVHPESKEGNPTEAKLQELWGKPDSKIDEKDGVVIWRYKTGMSMAGVVPMVGVGIPLVVPTGSDYTDIYIKNELAVKAHVSSTTWSGGYYGPANEGTDKKTFNKLGD
jgi:hypothetical protein